MQFMNISDDEMRKFLIRKISSIKLVEKKIEFLEKIARLYGADEYKEKWAEVKANGMGMRNNNNRCGPKYPVLISEGVLVEGLLFHGTMAFIKDGYFYASNGTHALSLEKGGEQYAKISQEIADLLRNEESVYLTMTGDTTSRESVYE